MKGFSWTFTGKIKAAQPAGMAANAVVLILTAGDYAWSVSGEKAL